MGAPTFAVRFPVGPQTFYRRILGPPPSRIITSVRGAGTTWALRSHSSDKRYVHVRRMLECNLPHLWLGGGDGRYNHHTRRNSRVARARYCSPRGGVFSLLSSHSPPTAPSGLMESSISLQSIPQHNVSKDMTSTSAFVRPENSDRKADAENDVEDEPDHRQSVERLQTWNEPGGNKRRYMATLWGFLIMGMNDAAYGVSG